MTLALEGIGKQVGDETHINELSLQLEPGSLTVLLGLTLSGKTTLMRLMAGLDKPTSGRILANGEDTARIALRKRNVAMVYQQFINYPSLSVYDNIASPLRNAKLPKDDIDERVQTEAKRLRIDAYLDRMPSELSGGQQQRVALARALVRDAELVLLDEPLVNLDYKLREELLEELPSAFKGRKSMVVYATTDPWEALTLGGKTAVLHEGRLVQYGSTVDVYTAPGNTHVASVFSDPPMNIVEGQLEARTLTLANATAVPRPENLSGLAEGRYLFGLRPEHIEVTALDRPHVIQSTVDVTEVSGSSTYVHFDIADQSWVALENGVHNRELGEALYLNLDPTQLFIYSLDGDLVFSPEDNRSGNDPTKVNHGTN